MTDSFGHEQGGRHTLVRNIADCDEQLVIAPGVVTVEVAANSFGGSHFCPYGIPNGALFQGLSTLGKHSHLDLGGGSQFSLQAAARRRDGFEVGDISLQVSFHRGEGLDKPGNLIVALGSG